MVVESAEDVFLVKLVEHLGGVDVGAVIRSFDGPVGETSDPPADASGNRLGLNHAPELGALTL